MTNFIAPPEPPAIGQHAEIDYRGLRGECNLAEGSEFTVRAVDAEDSSVRYAHETILAWRVGLMREQMRRETAELYQAERFPFCELRANGTRIRFNRDLGVERRFSAKLTDHSGELCFDGAGFFIVYLEVKPCR